MTEDAHRSADIHDLHKMVDLESAEAEQREDPNGAPDSQLQSYEARLRTLHDAVTAMEEYEDGLGNP